MEPPFTRERLRNIVDEVKENQREETIQKTAVGIMDAILSISLQRGYNRQSVVQHGKTKAVLHFDKIGYAYPQGMIEQQYAYQSGKNPLLPEVIARVKTMFPDSKFETDPLNTYMVIDWS